MDYSSWGSKSQTLIRYIWEIEATKPPPIRYNRSALLLPENSVLYAFHSPFIITKKSRTITFNKPVMQTPWSTFFDYL